MSLDPSSTVTALHTAGISHVVWIPDSHLGLWEAPLLESGRPYLIRATREGEVVAIAAGLLIGGARPLAVMQCTGFFEAGDAVRNIVHDLRLPLPMLIGVRSQRAFLAGETRDNCPSFTEPIVQAWQIPYTWIDPERDSPSDLITAVRSIERSHKAGIILWTE